MNFAFSYAVITLVSLGATIFIVLLNISQARKNLRYLDFKTVVIELLTLSIWVSMFIRFVNSPTSAEALANIILFILSIAFGALLIQSTMKGFLILGSISKLKEKQRSVTERLRDLDTQKTEFISLATHQLRGPLSSMIGHSSLLLEGEYGKMTKKMEEPIARIFESGKKMNDLINDFLDVSKIENNELAYNMHPTNIVSLIQSVTEDVEIVYERAEIKLEKHFQASDEVLSLVDKNQIKKVLFHILDNAVTYTKIGSVSIFIAKKNKDLIITIKDTGVGIDEEDIPNLFKKFVRGKNANKVSVTGIGLGLYVAREIIEAHNGRIWIESQGKGKGSTFYIALPIYHG